MPPLSLLRRGATTLTIAMLGLTTGSAHAADWNSQLARVDNSTGALSWDFTAQFLSQNDSMFTVCWRLNAQSGDVCNGHTKTFDALTNYDIYTYRSTTNLHMLCGHPYKIRIKKTKLIFDTIIASIPCQ